VNPITTDADREVPGESRAVRLRDRCHGRRPGGGSTRRIADRRHRQQAHRE
jgi:hypothetical protein